MPNYFYTLITTFLIALAGSLIVYVASPSASIKINDVYGFAYLLGTSLTLFLPGWLVAAVINIFVRTGWPFAMGIALTVNATIFYFAIKGLQLDLVAR